MWQKLLANPLVVTPDLYDSVLKRVMCIRATLHISNARYRERITKAFGRRASLDQNQCHGCCLGGEVESFEQIPIDISRSLPHFGVFSSLSPNSLRTHRERLRTILECAAVHRPDIGYVQGMASLAGVFLLYLDEYSAFKCLVMTLVRLGRGPHRHLLSFTTCTPSKVQLCASTASHSPPSLRMPFQKLLSCWTDMTLHLSRILYLGSTRYTRWPSRRILLGGCGTCTS